MRVIGFLVLGLVALYFYLVEYGESTVAEKNVMETFSYKLTSILLLMSYYSAQSLRGM